MQQDTETKTFPKPITGYTISMMAEYLGEEPNTIKQRLFAAKEASLTREAIFSKKSFLKIISVRGKGRPKKDK